MSLRCGIVGLPNVGKSTLFNALTATQAAQAANYPFCTIEPNVGIVDVPDNRLDFIAKIARTDKIVPARIEFVDIAGLVKGASLGEGLGNKFLSHIREVDAIIYVLRCFENSDIIHVEGRVNPCLDAEIIRTELALADVDSLERRIPNIEKKAKKDPESANELAAANDALKMIESGGDARSLYDKHERKIVDGLQLFSTKQFIYLCNVDEKSIALDSGNDFDDNLDCNDFSENINGGSIKSRNKYVNEVCEMAKKHGARVVQVSAQIESEIAALGDREEKKEFLATLGLKMSGLDKMIRVSYDILGLIVYFTAGEVEARAWTIERGWNAQKASGVIHSDFEKHFIRAEVISYEDYIQYSGVAGARDVGKMRVEGREYIVKDGDIMNFLIGR